MADHHPFPSCMLLTCQVEYWHDSWRPWIDISASQHWDNLAVRTSSLLRRDQAVISLTHAKYIYYNLIINSSLLISNSLFDRDICGQKARLQSTGRRQIRTEHNRGGLQVDATTFRAVNSYQSLQLMSSIGAQLKWSNCCILGSPEEIAWHSMWNNKHLRIWNSSF